MLLNKFLKFQLSMTLVVQTLAASAALVGSVMSLVWLERHAASIPLPALPRWDETAPLIIVDAGHGGHDGGAVANDVVEKNLALDLARRLKRELEAAGLRVRMTRDTDVFLSLEERAALTGRLKASAFVSVHLNTDGEGSAAEGIETYFADSKPLSARQNSAPRTSADFAEQVQRMVCASTKAQNRGTKARGYAVISQASCPAVLVECGFITNAEEAARLKRADYGDKVATGIAQGVAVFLQAHPPKADLVAAAE